METQAKNILLTILTPGVKLFNAIENKKTTAAQLIFFVAVGLLIGCALYKIHS